MKARAATPKKEDRRPTPDQMYLMDRLNSAHAVEAALSDLSAEHAALHGITIPALQRWNIMYGVAAVSDAMRSAWGFPPLGGIDNPFAYVDAILKAGK